MEPQFGQKVTFGHWRGMVFNPADSYTLDVEGGVITVPACLVHITESPEGPGRLWVVIGGEGDTIGQIGMFENADGEPVTILNCWLELDQGPGMPSPPRF